MEENNIDRLKRDIETKREILNNIIINTKDKREILKFSQELDKLIFQYYLLHKQ